MDTGASAIAVISLALQLVESFKKLYECWDSIKEAPRNARDIITDLQLLSIVLSEIACDAHHVEIDETTIAVLESCIIKCNTLLTLVHDLELSRVSTSSHIQNGVL